MKRDSAVESVERESTKDGEVSSTLGENQQSRWGG